jgi:hypothetical protein
LSPISDDEEDDGSCFVMKVEGIVVSISEDTLTMYFENRRRSGGDEIDHVEINRDAETALVYFKEGNGRSTVMIILKTSLILT